MKRIRSLTLIACLMLALCVLLPNAQAVRADDGGYYIKNYNVVGTVHDDASIDLRVTLDVYFTEARHGIYYFLPTYVSIDREDENGKTSTYYYETRMSDVSVADHPFEYSDNTIVIGDEDKTVYGDVRYVITYSYTFGDDKIDLYDEFYYSIVGAGWDCMIENVQFLITFEKDCDLSGLELYTGEFGSQGGSKVNYKAINNTIAGLTTEALLPNEAITAWVRLPEGYYANVQKVTPVFAYAALAALAAVAVYAVWRRYSVNQLKGRGEVVETVEFYPPTAVTSAEVGYIVDGSADQKDFVSLIVWLACKGYLRIEEDENGKTVITKERDLPADAPNYLREIMQAALSEKSKKKAGEEMFEAIQHAMSDVSVQYSGAKSLTDAKQMTKSVLTALASGILTFLSVFLCKVNGNGENLGILGAIGAVLISGWSLVALNLFQPVNITSKTGKIVAAVLLCIFGLLPCCGVFNVHESLYLNTVLAGILAVTTAYCVASTSVASDYKLSLMGKLRGFKTFIEVAELDRIKLLCEENPYYFYEVLPYAYVFGLTDVWIKQFEKLVVPPLYRDYRHSNGLYVWAFMHSCENTIESIQSNINEYAASKAHSSSGGGGFSGGGFGGGGGGSW